MAGRRAVALAVAAWAVGGATGAFGQSAPAGFHPAACGCPLCRGVQSPTVAPSAVMSAAADATGTDPAHPVGAPQLNSRPGAAYTLYLNFTGFNFTGGWGGNGSGQPGYIPAYAGTTTAFTPDRAAKIAQVWSAVADKYSGFDVNVTTVDPAVLAGAAASDAARQAYYDRTARVMHTVIGNTSFTAAGVSYVGVAQYAIDDADSLASNGGAGRGYHTNFVTPTGTGGVDGLKGMAEATGHENGHALSLGHQQDYSGTTLVNQYSTNGTNPGGGYLSGNGTVSPMMGASYYAQRGVFRNGLTDGAANQNDVAVVASQGGMNGLRDDAVAHATASATPLPLTANGTVNPAAAHGVIVPASATSPNAIGAANYTRDYYSFNSAGGSVSLTLRNGGNRVNPTAADLSPTLASSLDILDTNGNVLYTAAENYATQTATFSQTLPAGKYVARISSAGGQNGTTAYAPATYFDMGSYFLTGTGVSGGQSVGTYYWRGGASAAKWSQVDGSTTSNWVGEHTNGTDKGAAPSATDNVFLSVDAGATNLQAMTLGGNRTVNSVTFTGTGTTAATTGVTIAADGSTLTLTPNAGHIDQSDAGIASGVGLVVQPGAAANAIAANVALGVGQTWQLNNAVASPLTVSGTLSGAAGAGLTLTGGGKLALTGTNTYTGGTYVNAATVNFAAAGLGTGPVTLVNGGTLQWATGNITDLTTNNRAVAVITGGGTFDTNGNTVTLANGIGDAFAGAITKTGTGTLAVGGASNPTNLFVRAGRITLLTGANYSTANGGNGNQYASVGVQAGDNGGLQVNGGGTLTVAGDLNAGDNGGAAGTITVLADATVNARTLYLGKFGSAAGTVVQTGGTVQQADNGTTGGEWRIGGGGSASDKAATGKYTISGGTLNSGAASLQVGAYGTGTLAQTGGTVTTAGFLSVGRFAGSAGTLDVAGGTTTANAAARLIVGEQGTGTLRVSAAGTVNANVLSVAYGSGAAATGTVQQTGGTVNAPGGVAFGEAASGTAAVAGTYNLAGGTLVTSAVRRGTAGNVTAVLHLAGGGTLVPTGPTTTFVQGLTRADLGAGGGTVNTAGFDVTVAQPLLHDPALTTAADGGLTKAGAGTLTLAGIATYTGPTVAGAGTLAFAANPAGGGIRTQALPGGLTVAAGAQVNLLASAAPAARTLLVPTGLSIAGRLDLANNDLDVPGGSLADLTAAAAAGFAGGTWAGTTGLLSTVAAADAARLTAVGVVPNSADGGGSALYPTFDGRPAAATDVLARLTYYGDANLDGRVDAADYTRLDAGFLLGGTAWLDGDFNYDGRVDASDYTLADNAFNHQQGGVAAPAARVAADVAAVPEPATLAVAAAALLLGRRRRVPG